MSKADFISFDPVYSVEGHGKTMASPILVRMQKPPVESHPFGLSSRAWQWHLRNMKNHTFAVYISEVNGQWMAIVPKDFTCSILTYDEICLFMVILPEIATLC